MYTTAAMQYVCRQTCAGFKALAILLRTYVHNYTTHILT